MLTDRRISTIQVDGKGILNQKTIETEVLAATTDAEWKQTAKVVVSRCYKEASGNF
jgi:hypothetical protein